MVGLVTFLIFPHSYNYWDSHDRLIHGVVFIPTLGTIVGQRWSCKPILFLLAFPFFTIVGAIMIYLFTMLLFFSFATTFGDVGESLKNLGHVISSP